VFVIHMNLSVCCCLLMKMNALYVKLTFELGLAQSEKVVQLLDLGFYICF